MSNLSFAQPGSRKMIKARRGYANNLTAWVPQFWSSETLAILNERMFGARTVYRGFSNEIAELGDTVNTRRPSEYTALRKDLTDDVTIQDASATNVQIKLDQHFHVSLLIRDGEMSKGMKQMSRGYMVPAAVALIRQMDRVIFGQYARFLNNGVGALGTLTSANAKDYILNTRQRLDEQKSPEGGRQFVVNPKTETDLLRPEWFTSADKRGDTEGLREASIGHKFGFDFWKSLNMPNILPGMTLNTKAMSAAALQGASSVTTATFTTALPVGSWVTVDGMPNIVATGGSATVTNLRWPLTRGVSNGSNVVAVVAGALVNNGSGYAAGYSKEITIDTTTAAPKIGMPVTFGTSNTSAIYSVINVTSNTGITLDRPLEAALADNDAVNFGPDGAYNFAYHKNAIAFVSRPLALPDPETGVKASVASLDDISLRVTMQYQGMKQGTLITFDLLCGIAVLDNNMGAVMLA